MNLYEQQKKNSGRSQIQRMWVDLSVFWCRAEEMWQELQASMDELPET